MSQFDSLKSSIKHYKFRSIFVRNFIIILIVVMIPLDIISLFFYSNSSKSVRQEIYQTTYNFTYTFRSIIDTLMKEMQTLAINTSMQSEVNTYIFNKPVAGAENIAQTELIDYCKNYTYTHKYLHSIYIYSESTDTILSDTSTWNLADFSDQSWIDEYRTMTHDGILTVLRARNNHYPYFLTIIKPIFSTDTDKTGAIIVNINIQELTKNFQYLDDSSAQKLYIVNNDNRIIYSEIQDEILCDIRQSELPSAILTAEQEDKFSFSHNGVSYLLAGIESQFFNWQYYCIVPMKLYAARTTTTVLYLLLLMFLSLVVSIIGAFYLSTRTFRPIGSILELISSTNENSVSLYSDSLENESTYILSRIRSTLAINRQLKEELETKLILLKHAQIVALQSQINPHFMFNTLDTINWMAIDAFDGDNPLSTALTTLADLFKLNIDTSNYLTDLEGELNYAKQYVKILKLRYQEIFDVDWFLDESLVNCKVPRLTLQPLIENALYHGIKPKRANGLITVTIKKENDLMLIQITDDGVGLDASALEQLTNELEQDYLFGAKHVGLKNINQRVKLIYGDEYGIRIESNQAGTTISLRMPLFE